MNREGGDELNAPLWPIVLPKLRELRDHYARRYGRMGYLAQGGRVNWHAFPFVYTYVEGKRDALEEVLVMIDDGRVREAVPLDLAVVLLAREGTEAEIIAARCGVSIEDVANTLIRYAQASAEVEAELRNEGGDRGELAG